MSTPTRSARRIAVGAVGAGALAGGLLFGAVPAAQAAPAPAVAPHANVVELVGAFSPAAAPAGLPARTGSSDILPIWHHHGHGFGHHHHHRHWWNPLRWFWFW